MALQVPSNRAAVVALSGPANRVAKLANTIAAAKANLARIMPLHSEWSAVLSTLLGNRGSDTVRQRQPVNTIT
jgi:hypothetical protein